MNARNSHLAALGLVRNPFPYTPDAGCYFTTPHLDEQLVELEHCVVSRKGFSLLTAEVGMGKSTLVRRLMTDLAAKNVVSALVFNTFLQGPELLAAVLQDFGLEGTGTLPSDISALNTFLLANHCEGKTCLLIIDDAQNLSANSLELIRLLCNLETDQEKLLQILLAGQTELEEMLSQHSLRQLRSRLVKHSRLYGLTSTEIADYVRFRFESSGSDGALVLQTDACQLLWRETQGVPRQIHLIMDRCLYGLAARNGNVIDSNLMKEAVNDSRVDLVGAPTADAVGVVPPARARRPWLVAAAFAGLVATGAALGSRFGGVDAGPGQPRADGAAAQGVALAPASPDPAPAPAPQAATPAAPAVAALSVAPDASAAQGVPAVAPGGLFGAGCEPATEQPAGRMVVSQPLAELTHQLLGARLARLADVCLDNRQGQVWLTWSTPQAGHAVNQRLTAARFQIALTEYGSLLPREVDGIWGERSRGALRQFQNELGLSPSGEVDPLSGLLLEKFYVQEQ
jgi:general secretion pathway protein A